MEYYTKIAVFFGVLDGLTSQCECFIGLLSFGRAEYDNLSLFNIYFKAHGLQKSNRMLILTCKALGLRARRTRSPAQSRCDIRTCM